MYIQSEPDNDKPYKGFCIRRTEWYHGEENKPYKVRWQAIAKDGRESFYWPSYDEAVKAGTEEFTIDK